MIRCTCQNITDSLVNQIMDSYNMTEKEALRYLGAGEVCGRCQLADTPIHEIKDQQETNK